MHLFAILVLARAYTIFTRAQIFNPVHYGAKGDGISDDTVAMRTTLKSLSANKGGELLVEEQFAFLTGGFNITSNFILNVKGKILASQDSNDYIPKRDELQWQPVVQGYGQSNITITGGGIIDGQGAPWWYCFHRENASLHLPPCNGLGR